MEKSPKDVLVTTKDKPFIKLDIDEDYQDFNDFYQTNRETIYKNIINLFMGLKTSKKKYLKLVVHSKIDGETWGTEFIFDKSQIGILVNDILPFFEKREEYEVCGEIMKIYNSITGVIKVR